MIGQLRVEGTKSGRWDPIEILSVGGGADRPTNDGTGRTTGRLSFTPITVVKAVDASSPQLFKSLVENEDLKEAYIDIFAPGTSNAPGAPLVEWQYKLEFAGLVSMEASTAGSSISEKVGPTFGRICILHIPGRTESCFSTSPKV